MKFFDAQKSGNFNSNQFSWKKKIGVNDGFDQGVDLSGGWETEGFYSKFTYPNASSLILLAISILEFKDSIESNNLINSLYSIIKWNIDYLMKCDQLRTKGEVYVLCGDPENRKWQRMLEFPDPPRQCYKIDSKNPGSDVASEIASGFALSSIIYKDINNTLSQDLLQRAINLYNFANNHQGIASESIQELKGYYKDDSFQDELMLAEIFLYRASNDTWDINLNTIENLDYLNWKHKNILNCIFVAKYSQNIDIQLKAYSILNNFFDKILTKISRKSRTYLVYSNQDTSTYAINFSNSIFLSLFLLDQTKINNYQQLYSLAKAQIDYLLGVYSRTYVVGYFSNTPTRPYHIESSCPSEGECGNQYRDSKASNLNQLYGAVVGGINKNGQYEDDRNDFIKNGVSVYRNSAMVLALSRLLTDETTLAGVSEVFGDYLENSSLSKCLDLIPTCEEHKLKWNVCADDYFKTQCKLTCCVCGCKNTYTCENYLSQNTCFRILSQNQCSLEWQGYMCQYTCDKCLNYDCYKNCSINQTGDLYDGSNFIQQIDNQNGGSCSDKVDNCQSQLLKQDICSNQYWLSVCPYTCCSCRCPSNEQCKDYIFESLCLQMKNEFQLCGNKWWQYVCQKTCDYCELNSCINCQIIIQLSKKIQ